MVPGLYGVLDRTLEASIEVLTKGGNIVNMWGGGYLI